MVELSLHVNGMSMAVEVSATSLLCDALRDELGLRGTKVGCREGSCGSCSVLVDGDLVRSCLMLTAQAAERSVTTIEGIGDADQLHRVQAAFVRYGAVQCGFCTPGLVMAAVALLAQPEPIDREDVVGGISGNLCRCTGYTKVVDAIAAVAEAAQDPDR